MTSSRGGSHPSATTGLMKNRAPLYSFAVLDSLDLRSHVQHSLTGAECPLAQLVLATMNSSGRVVSIRTFSTSHTALIRYVTALSAQSKDMALEESSLACWIASALRPYLTQLIVCDPRHNALISHRNKNDRRDVVDFCRLLRLWNPLGCFTQIKRAERTSRLQSNSIYVFGRIM